MIKLFNTLSRKKEIFKPIHSKYVGLYTCGPTVYSYAHIGNLRTYVFEDILRRSLESGGYKVKHVMNITDIDDKTIKGARAENKSLKVFTRKFESFFKEDLKKLNIKSPTIFIRATEHVADMVRLILKLLKKSYAYKKSGSVYFNISKFQKYGALTHLDKKKLRSGVRVDQDEYSKNEAQDFVLWKAKKIEEPSWKAPFGEGRPGWHIECSAMSMKYLGGYFDIHAGGVDLIFPHHENEIAQSESVTGKKFVKYWMHGEHLAVNGQKMSKSLRNIFTLQDIEKKSILPLAFRYFVLSANYRSKLNFTWEALEASKKALERLYEFVRTLKIPPQPAEPRRGLGRYLNLFQSALSDDLNTPKALAILWDIVHGYNKNPQKFNAREVLNLLYKFDEILGLGLKKIKHFSIPKEIIKLALRREEYRKLKNWTEADKIREKIEKKGYLIEDGENGPKLSPTSALLV